MIKLKVNSSKDGKFSGRIYQTVAERILRARFPLFFSRSALLKLYGSSNLVKSIFNFQGKSKE